MPIRFRCAYCHQLMGIARRKAGTVVRCPTCAGQVIVPSPPPGTDLPGQESQEPKPVDGGGLFEMGDIEKELQGATAASAAASAPAGDYTAPSPAPPSSQGGKPRYDVVPLNAPAGMASFSEPLDTEPGVFLTRGKVVVLGVLVLLLLGLVFWLGMLVGSAA